MDAPVVAHLRDEDLVPVRVHAGLDVAGTEVTRIRHAMRLDPTDGAMVADQDFVLVESVVLMLSPYLRTLD